MEENTSDSSFCRLHVLNGVKSSFLPAVVGGQKAHSTHPGSFIMLHIESFSAVFWGYRMRLL